MTASEVPSGSAVDGDPDLFSCTPSTSREPASPTIYNVDSERIYNVAIALGSNLGDSFHNIEYALRLLEYLPQEEHSNGKDLPFVRIIDTSFLYKTKPMYVTEQPAFINAACMVYFILLSNQLLSSIVTRSKQTYFLLPC